MPSFPTTNAVGPAAIHARAPHCRLADARRAGFRTIDGLSMLIGQADHAFRRFFGAAPPREADAELRKVLGA